LAPPRKQSKVNLSLVWGTKPTALCLPTDANLSFPNLKKSLGSMGGFLMHSHEQASTPLRSHCQPVPQMMLVQAGKDLVWRHHHLGQAGARRHAGRGGRGHLDGHLSRQTGGIRTRQAWVGIGNGPASRFLLLHEPHPVGQTSP